MYTTFSDEYDVVLLVNHEQPKFDISYIDRIQKYVSIAFGITVSAAFDTGEGNIESLAELHRKTKYAMQYRLIKGKNSIISYSDIKRRPIVSNDYPSKTEKAILREIAQKNNDEVFKYVDEFIVQISSLSYISIIVNSYSLINAVDNLYKNSKTESDGETDVISDDLLKSETISDIKDMITAHCSDALISMSNAKIDDKHTLIANNIEDYILNHYTDPNLSIDLIASHVNKSANYARSIFKQNKGISISDYISKIRFDEVCRLLVETNLTAQTISKMIGMSSGSYFYTAFKKYTGYTPEQYRKKFSK